MKYSFDSWVQKGDCIVFPDNQFFIDKIISAKHDLYGWQIEYVDDNGHHRTWNQFYHGGALIQYH